VKFSSIYGVLTDTSFSKSVDYVNHYTYE